MHFKEDNPAHTRSYLLCVLEQFRARYRHQTKRSAFITTIDKSASFTLEKIGSLIPGFYLANFGRNLFLFLLLYPFVLRFCFLLQSAQRQLLPARVAPSVPSEGRENPYTLLQSRPMRGANRERSMRSRTKKRSGSHGL